MTTKEEIKVHTCKGLEAHNIASDEENGNSHSGWKIYNSGHDWRFASGNEQWLIEYCPYCGVKLDDGVMSKQEEIREGIAIQLEVQDCPSCELSDDCDKLDEPGSPCLLQVRMAKKIFSYLQSQGVVLKVERELPRNPYFDTKSKEALLRLSEADYDIEVTKKWKYNNAQEDMLKAGYVAVEPLIEVTE